MTDDSLRRALRAASCAVALLVARPARAQDQAAILGLTVNRVDRGEIRVVLRGDDVLVARSDLEAAGIRGFAATEVEEAGRKLVSLASVRPAVHFDVDVDDVVLRIDAPVELLPAHHIDLSTRPPEVSYAHRTSAFLNYGPTLTVSTLQQPVANGFFEGGLSDGNRLWYSGLYAASDTGVARGLSNVTFDQPNMRRLTLGDANVSAGAIGGVGILGGVTYARDFTMDPYFIPFPSMRFASATEVPARVDVYVNGVRVKSEEIEPGTFTLDNVRGLVGAGTVRYVVTDALGRMQAYSAPYYVGPQVLAKGVDDYAVSVGFPRDNLGLASFDYEGPALISYYQRGLTDAVTAGARAEARLDRVSGGPSIATSTPFGIFALEGGASATTDGHSGGAGVFSYQFLSRGFSAGASVRTQSSEYANATLSPDMDRSLLQATTFLSVPIGHRASLGSDFTIDAHRDVAPYARVDALSQVQLGREFSLLGEVALVTLGPPSSSLDGFVSLVWMPGASMNATAGVQKQGNVSGASFQFNRPGNIGEDWAMQAALALSQTPEASVNHQLQTSANTVLTYFDWSPGSATLSVSPAGSVDWVDGAGFFLSRPVYDAFGLVRVPDVKDVRVYLNSQLVGRTDASGDVLVPSMLSYYGSELKVAPEDVPLTYSLDWDKITAAPPRRGAAYVQFPARRIHYYRGRLRWARGTVEEIPAYGDFAVDPGPKEAVSPIGDGGDFELEGIRTGRHHAEIRWKARTCRFSFEAMETSAALVDLGTLVCREK